MCYAVRNKYQIDKIMKRRDLFKFLPIKAVAIALVFFPAKQAEASKWSYRGETGTDFWGEIDPEFSTCTVGEAQSPINVESAVTSDISNLKLNYQDTPLKIVNNGRTIRVDYQPGSSLALDDQVYELLQFHFHQPSEHLIAGETFKMEAHFVHKNKITGNLVVLAVLMSQGQINQALDRIWQKIPFTDQRESKVSDLMVNALQLLPKNQSQYYRYQGSLTTPPCSEIVTWLILKQPVEVSKLQIARFIEVIGPNARPVQPLNSRVLSESN